MKKELYRIACFTVLILLGGGALRADVPPVLIHEVAWAGMLGAKEKQWVELFNASAEVVELDGWRLVTASGSVESRLSGRLFPGHSYLIARDPEAFPGIPVDAHLPGMLDHGGDSLLLLDASSNRVDGVGRWYAGDLRKAASMQRVYPYGRGDAAESWHDSPVRYEGGWGTPGFRMPPASSGQKLYRVYNEPNSINVFFNQSALTGLALPGNEANHGIDLEERIISRIRQARERIDVAAYEINLEGFVDALIERAAAGVAVRVIVDAKSPGDDLRQVRYTRMRLYLERLRRGRDGIIGTADDVHIFANSPILAIGRPDVRDSFGLPADAGGELERVRLQVGLQQVEGYLLAEGMKHECEERYYSSAGQMHNKFILIDDYRLLTGSMNLTETDTHGHEEARSRGEMHGNANNLLDIHAPGLVEAYRAEFDQMWGASGVVPCPSRSRFRGLKARRGSPHTFDLGGTRIDLYFSPGYNVIPAIASFVKRHAEQSVHFCIFAWSDSELENTIKRKWEGSGDDLQGNLTGFTVRGVFERIYWNQWWSANNNMLGKRVSRSTHEYPNIRWKRPPPVYRDAETRKLHHKYMLIDVEEEERATLITGSANWSRNANEHNDENTLFIRNALIANQYLQEFYARYISAGGRPPHDELFARTVRRPVVRDERF